MYDVETFKKAYPEWFMPTTAPTALDIITGVVVLALVFLIPYLYIRFIEARLFSFVRGRLAPFIRFRLHLGKLIDSINRILKIRIFGT